MSTKRFESLNGQLAKLEDSGVDFLGFVESRLECLELSFEARHWIGRNVEGEASN